MNERELVLYEKDGPIAWLTLNRPESLNAVNLEMRDLLWTYLEAVRDDPDVRVIGLRGAGPRAFCSGADVTEFGSSPSYLQARDARRQRDLWGTMLTSSKPLIAAVHGYVLGAGCEMSLYCDLRIATEDARFGLPEVTLGYVPSAGGTQTLPRTIPRGVARDMVMTGEPINAARALALGLVHRVVPAAALAECARAAALALAAVPPRALSLAREALRTARDLPLSQGLTQAALLARLAAQAGGAEAAHALATWELPC